MTLNQMNKFKKINCDYQEKTQQGCMALAKMVMKARHDNGYQMPTTEPGTCTICGGELSHSFDLWREEDAKHFKINKKTPQHDKCVDGEEPEGYTAYPKHYCDIIVDQWCLYPEYGGNKKISPVDLAFKLADIKKKEAKLQATKKPDYDNRAPMDRL